MDAGVVRGQMIRRNGKISSCEPCRRSKVRCDHEVPVCGRCSRLKRADECRYILTPGSESHTRPNFNERSTSMAGLISAPTPAQTPSLPPAYSRHFSLDTVPTRPDGRFPKVDQSTLISTSSSTSSSTPNLYSLPTPTLTLDHISPPSAAHAVENEPTMMRDDQFRFLGPTSYAAVLAPTSDTLGLEREPSKSDSNTSGGVISELRIQQGVEALTLLSDLPGYTKLIKRWFDLGEGSLIPNPLLLTWLDELWSEHGHILKYARRDQLCGLVELMWKNSRRRVSVTGHTSPEEWARSTSGKHLRWDVVGLLFSLLGIIAVNYGILDSDGEFQRSTPGERTVIARRMCEYADLCQSFCSELASVDDVYLCLLHENRNLSESLHGDAHHSAWQKTSELCDAIILAGLHRGNNVDQTTPFFLSEIRKRLFASAYGRDKIVASFVGRPPRLARRYCRIELPLDLSDNEILLEGSALFDALGSLGPGGWNTTGTTHRITWLRMWFNHCLLREEILEIALGYGDEDKVAQAEEIRGKLNQLPSDCPAIMNRPLEEILQHDEVPIEPSLKAHDASDSSSSKYGTIFAICLHAGNVYTEFLLQRALVNLQHSEMTSLIPLARRLLGLVLLAQSKQLFFGDFQGDLVFLLAFHGLPAASILAVELLKQAQSPPSNTVHLLPRSQTIQDLSIFISSLEAVSPHEGNHWICHRGGKMLKRILDQVLSPTQHQHHYAHSSAFGSSGTSSTVENMTHEINLEGEADPMFWSAGIGSDAAFMQWLYDVEWDKVDWAGALSPYETNVM